MKRRKDSLNSLVTKSYLKSELKRGLGALETRVDLKLDSLRIEIDENARKYRDEILNEFDKFAKISLHNSPILTFLVAVFRTYPTVSIEPRQ